MIIFLRVLSGPVYGYLTYGFIPLITLGLFFLQYLQNIKHKVKSPLVSLVLVATIGSAYCWIFLTIENKEILNIPYNLNLKGRISEHRQGKVYYDKVGYFVTPRLYEQYRMINDYIEKHTAIDDYLFVYPWGACNHFTKRPSPLTARDPYDLLAGEYFIEEALNQLEAKKPKYVVINTYNNSAIALFGGKRGDVGDSATWGTAVSPSFAGKGSKLEVYILENYELEKKFDYAGIMIRRKEKKHFEREFDVVYSWRPKNKQIDYEIDGMKKINKDSVFKIGSRSAYIEHRLKDPIICSHVEVDFRIENNFFRRAVSKSLLTFT